MADSSSSLSPEKRLLQLIEGGSQGGTSAGGSGGGPEGGGSEKPPKMPSKTPQEWAAFAKEKAQNFFADFKSKINLKTANKTAQIGLVCLALIALANTAYEIHMANSDPLKGLEVSLRKMVPIDLDETNFDAGTLQNSDARNVFLPFAKREEIKSVAAPVGAGRLVEMTKNFRLTGISYDPENAKAAYCMIEDLQKSITTFLRVGDKISGIKVAKILEDSVELEYEGEKIEIH